MLPVFKNCWIELQINLTPAAGFCRGSSVFLCLWKQTLSYTNAFLPLPSNRPFIDIKETWRTIVNGKKYLEL